MAVIFVGLVWVATILLLLESAFVLRWHLLVKSNPLIKKKDFQVQLLSEVKYLSLWKEPWISYKENAKLFLRRGDELLSLRINSIGLRSGEVTLPKPEGRFRILCIGGSTTVEGRTNETTYPAILERRLNAWWGGPHFEVINGGITGITSDTILRRLDFFTSLEPDLVIHYNGVNDYAWIILPNLRNLAPRWHRLLSRSELVKTLFPRLVIMEDDLFDSLLSKCTLANSWKLISRFRERNIPVAMASFDTPDVRSATPEERFYLDYDLRTYWGADQIPYEVFQKLIDKQNEMIRSLCQEEGCLYFPVAENLSLGVNVYVDICHMTPNGIERKAEVIAGMVVDYLKSIGHLPVSDNVVP